MRSKCARFSKGKEIFWKIIEILMQEDEKWGIFHSGVWSRLIYYGLKRGAFRMYLELLVNRLKTKLFKRTLLKSYHFFEELILSLCKYNQQNLISFYY
jgi:hypothetical protein